MGILIEDAKYDRLEREELKKLTTSELIEIFEELKEDFNDVFRETYNVLAYTEEAESNEKYFKDFKALLKDIEKDADFMNKEFKKDVFVDEEEHILDMDSENSDLDEMVIDALQIDIGVDEFKSLSRAQKLDLLEYVDQYLYEVDRAFVNYLRIILNKDDAPKKEESEILKFDTEESQKKFKEAFDRLTSKPEEKEDPDKLTKYTAKADKGKLPITFVPTQFIRDVAKIRQYGNNKYHSPANWVIVEKERYKDALMRHLLAYLDDEDSVDEESGLLHLWHAACNIAFLCEMKRPDWEEQKQRIIDKDPEFKKKLKESNL